MTESAALWAPSQKQISSSRLNDFRQQAEKISGRSLPDYQSLWQWSVDDIESFWSSAWDFLGVIGDKGTHILENPDRVSATEPRAHFFPDAKLNFAENLLRRRDAADAIVFRGEDKVERRLSYAQLYDRVSQLAQLLKNFGVTKGDRVAGLVSHMPEAIIAILRRPPSVPSGHLPRPTSAYKAWSTALAR